MSLKFNKHKSNHHFSTSISVIVSIYKMCIHHDQVDKPQNPPGKENTYCTFLVKTNPPGKYITIVPFL